MESYRLSVTIENDYHEDEKPFQTQPLCRGFFFGLRFMKLMKQVH